MAQDLGEDAKCTDHDWWPLGVIRPQGGSAAYCRSCYALRWLNAKEWAAAQIRRSERYVARHGGTT